MMSDEHTLDKPAWGSHLPALGACLACTTGNVVELGVGHFSTPFLHAVCCSVNRMVLSVEQDSAWMNLLAAKWSCELHSFLCQEYDEALREIVLHQWSVALVDDSPGGERRKKDFVALLPVSEFVIVHDYHRENEEAIAPLLAGLKWFVSSDYDPPTLVASRFRDIPKGLNDPNYAHRTLNGL